MRNAFAPALLALLAVFLALPGCQPKPKADGLGSPGIVSCGTQAVAAHAAEMLGPVNRCLAGEGSVETCLLGLVQPSVGVGIDVIGCLTRHEGSSASAASQANPDDQLDRRRARRAREFLENMAARGYEFRD